ncbi:putative extracellular nuclease [Lachnospiraceae bacterium JC7]|nr:putative extracellular nuclease [Lachnospiraceae bacterium JC7]
MHVLNITRRSKQIKMNTKETNDRLAWEEVCTEHIIQDEWIDFRKSSWRFPDGNVVEPFYSYSRKDYVVIVATDTGGSYICVKQFRQGIKCVTTEFPAGGIEGKDEKVTGSSVENPKDPVAISEPSESAGSRERSEEYSEELALQAAKRELLEETGYESQEWRHLITVPSNATIADNYAHIFVAENCRKVSGQILDDTEFVNVVNIPPQEIEKMIKEGNFQQAVHIMAWLMYKTGAIA